MRKLMIGFLLAGLLLSGGLTAQQRRQAEIDLAAAIRTETVGDLTGAVKQYEDIVKKHAKEDAVAAQALLRMANVYQKLGNMDARRLYELVVRDYSDQTEHVADAKAQLKALQPAAPSGRKPVMTRDLTVSWESMYRAVSSDGRYALSIPDTGAVLHDLASDSSRRLEGVIPPYGGAFSRDSKQFAYAQNGEVRVLNIEDPVTSRYKTLYASPDTDWIAPHDWTPDHKWIVVSVGRKDKTTQIVLVPVENGSPQILKSMGWKPPAAVFLSPNGESLAYDISADDWPRQRDVWVLALDGSSDRRVVSESTDDMAIGWSPDGKYLLYASDNGSSRAALRAVPHANASFGGSILLLPDIGLPTSSLGVTRSGALYLTFEQYDPSPTRVIEFDFSTEPSTDSPKSSERLGYPLWSPDGRTVLYQSTRRGLGRESVPTLTIRSAENGELIREVHPRVRSIGSIRWAPDGRSFLANAFSDNGRWGIYRLDAETDSVTALIDCGCVGAQPAYSHEATGVYYLRRPIPSGPRSLVFHDLGTGQEREVSAAASDFHLSPDGKYIAITAESGQWFSLLPTDGIQPRQFPGRVRAWAPDSRSLLVSLDRELLLMTLDGQSRRVGGTWISFLSISVNPNGRQFALSPLGNRATFSVRLIENFLPESDSQVRPQSGMPVTYQLSWVDRTGKILEKIKTQNTWPGYASDLSPDGKRLATEGTNGSYTDIVELATGVVSRFPLGGDGTQRSFPIWSPDGQRLAFFSVRNGKTGIYTKLIDGTAKEETLIESVSQPGADLSWSRDGRFIVYNSRALQTGWDIWALPLAGDRKPFPIVQTPFAESGAKVSPDGKWVAYFSDRSGRSEVYIRTFPVGTAEWRVSTEAGEYLRWRADSKELYVRRRSSVFASEIRLTESGVQPAIPQQLFCCVNDYAATNGTRFLTIHPYSLNAMVDSIAESERGKNLVR